MCLNPFIVNRVLIVNQVIKIRKLCSLLLLVAAFQAGAADGIWQSMDNRFARSAEPSAREYRVDMLALRQRLQEAALRRPQEPPQIIRLPMPDGSIARFHIYESSIMQAALARRFPDIRTYKVYGIDDPGASGRLDITPLGFHAMLHTSQGRVFIDPDSSLPQNDRYSARAQGPANGSAMICGVDEHEFTSAARPAASPVPVAARTAARVTGALLEYRLAVSATAEYVTAVGGSVALAQASIVTTINRVNQIYERDLGIRLVLVANNSLLIESGNNVIFSNNDPSALFVQNQAWVDSTIGRDNYDVGHVFATAGGGLAFLGSACDGANKAKGVSGIPDPTGDPFNIDFVAHEIGHQFNADHSFNGTTMSCLTARNPATAFEPGSGSSIMGYAGLCGVENLQLNSDATFHAGSIAQINAFTASAGSCAVLRPNPANPADPIVATLASRTIPANTAFMLNGSAVDADGDLLSYQWDQMDSGCPTDAVSFGTDIGSNALFRTFPPRTSSQRDFPALGTQVRGLYDDAEVIPCNNRDLDFRLTVRDDKSGQGSADVRVTVVDTGEGFAVTDINGGGKTIVGGAFFNVNWNDASTARAPINCSTVDVELLTFAPGYTSYSIHPLAMGTANDGAASVATELSKNWHPRARIRVSCANNIFYDISDVDLEVTGSGLPTDLFDDDDIAVFANMGGTTGIAPPVCGVPVECPIQDPNSVGSRGSGAFDYRWGALLAVLLPVAALRRRRSVLRACSAA